jgi:beta-glucosidase
MKQFTVLLVMTFLLITCKKYEFPFQNPDLPLEKRVNDLVSRLTLEEKVSQMLDVAPGIERLGIPAYNWWNEALHGVARAGTATVFPQAIGLAATWDTDLIYTMADVISTEARAKHHEAFRNGDYSRYKGLTIWSPNINIFRDPRWGRGQETYGEDPYLTSRIGVNFVKGLQGDDPDYLKTISTPKHYAVHSGPEPDRHTFDAVVSKRDLLETYLPAFEATVREGGAWSVMGAYNRFLGEACCASPLLLQDYLRTQWEFPGYVVSDCGAINDIYAHHKLVETPEEAAALAVKSGTDLNCGRTYHHLLKAVEKELITEAEIDVAVERLFEARFRLGMFDPPDRVTYAQIPFSENDKAEHRALSLTTAQKSIVLLTNKDNLLPLNGEIKSLLITGPNMNEAEVMYGNYNGTPSQFVTPLQGIKNKVGDKVRILTGRGPGLVQENLTETITSAYLSTPDGKPGLQAQFFKNDSLGGDAAVTRIDDNIHFSFGRTAEPAQGVPSTQFSARWSGRIKAPVKGKYLFQVTGDDGFRLFIDNELHIDKWQRQFMTTADVTLSLKAGEEKDITLEYFNGRFGGIIDLSWQIPGTDPLKETVTLAKEADAVIFVGGLSPRLEGEEMRIEFEGFKGGDRTKIELPKIQTVYLKALQKTGKPVIFINMSGSAVAFPWEAEHLDAIIQLWYPGQEGGTALADVLFGDYNPAGRLPVTFYRSTADLPPFEEYNMTNRTYKYFGGEALYPFGYGLSYTTFNYGNIKLPATVKAGEPVTVTVDVTNSGKQDGEEVVQVYVTDDVASAPVPIRALQGFKRIAMKAGETQTVSFDLLPKQLSLIDDEGNRVVEPGTFTVAVGGGQPIAEPASTSGTVSGVFEVTGDLFQIE